MSEPRLIKVRLTNRGEDSESPWAHDLGPLSGPHGARTVRLANVPFLHAKPTWGDVIGVVPDDAGMLTWDRDGVPWSQISTRIVEDGGRWAMIVDYAADDGAAAFAALAQACAEHDVICEGAWAPRGGDHGRVYLAVPHEVSDAEIMRALRSIDLPCELFQIHPEPAPAAIPLAAARPGRQPRAATVPAAGIPGARPPAAVARPAAPARPRATPAPAKAAAPVKAKAKPTVKAKAKPTVKAKAKPTVKASAKQKPKAKAKAKAKAKGKAKPRATPASRRTARRR